jgi:predicted unusual protein kinase regulating ubiquinone biosynthesis (AarF/ABC1/UbiB family)
MEFVEGVPLLDTPLDYESRRDAARLVFRRLILGPLFSGLPESIFHADPHAGNLTAQTQKALRKPFLTLDGTPISMPGWKPSQHACGVSASEAVVRTWSIL